MKKVLVFITLKLAELFGFISICIAFARLGRIYFSLMGFQLDFMHSYLELCISFLWGLSMTGLAVVAAGLIGWGVVGIIRENWKLVK